MRRLLGTDEDEAPGVRCQDVCRSEPAAARSAALPRLFRDSSVGRRQEAVSVDNCREAKPRVRSRSATFSGLLRCAGRRSTPSSKAPQKSSAWSSPAPSPACVSDNSLAWGSGADPPVLRRRSGRSDRPSDAVVLCGGLRVLNDGAQVAVEWRSSRTAGRPSSSRRMTRWRFHRSSVRGWSERQ